MSDEMFLTSAMEGDLDTLKDLARKIDAISNDRRLRLMIIIGAETRNRREYLTDIRELTTILNHKYGIPLTQNGVKKHLDVLMKVGLVKKEPGFAERSMRGERAVINYVPVTGSLESIITDIKKLSTTITNFKEEISETDYSHPMIRVMGGDDDGMMFPLVKEVTRVGRQGELDLDNQEFMGDVVLSNDYKSVTRVTHPHATITLSKGNWYLEDCNSKCGVFLNNDEKTRDKIKLKDGDKIKLALGEGGAELVFISNQQ